MFGAMLKNLRQKKKLSLRKAARLIKFSHTYLWELERDNKPLSLPTLVRICESYGYMVAVSAIPIHICEGKVGEEEEVVSWIV